MAENVTYSQAHNIIHVKSNGDVTAKDIKQSLCEIAKIRNEKKLSNVLVDQINVESIPSDAAAFNLGSDVALILKGMNIAIIHSRVIKNDMEFFEKVTQVRGGNLRIFENPYLALHWLESQSKIVTNKMTMLN